jgi:two-component system NtrC family sensor kinase
VSQHLRSVLCVPLVCREALAGLIYLDNRLVRGLFGDRDILLLKTFAAEAAIAIETASAYASLEGANRTLRDTQARLVQSAKMSALGQLAAGVSHEIRNPLNIIAGSIYLLKDLLRREPNKKVHDYLTHIEEEVARAAALTENLLELARPADAPSDDIDLNAVLGRAIPLIAKLVAQRRLTLERDLAPALPRVRGNAGQLQQVFVNLLLNAAQAMHSEGRILVRTAPSPDGTSVVASVEDTGCGISPDDLERLFEPFFTKRQGGTGLGLYVTYSIVERHGGRIHVESEPGRGTTFRITLPAAPAALAVAEAAPILADQAPAA